MLFENIYIYIYLKEKNKTIHLKFQIINKQEIKLKY